MADEHAPYPTRAFSGLVWRMLDLRRQLSPLSGEGARRYGGRWNMKGWPALYLSTQYNAALAEFHGGVPRPGTLVPYRAEASKVVDLTMGVNPDIAVALECDWKTIALIEGEVPASWTLAHSLIASGADGALVPSKQLRGGVNLVLWRWRGAGEAGDGAELTVLDPDRVLGGAS